jgi:hypothetical protein
MIKILKYLLCGCFILLCQEDSLHFDYDIQTKFLEKEKEENDSLKKTNEIQQQKEELLKLDIKKINNNHSLNLNYLNNQLDIIDKKKNRLILLEDQDYNNKNKISIEKKTFLENYSIFLYKTMIFILLLIIVYVFVIIENLKKKTTKQNIKKAFLIKDKLLKEGLLKKQVIEIEQNKNKINRLEDTTEKQEIEFEEYYQKIQNVKKLLDQKKNKSKKKKNKIEDLENLLESSKKKLIKNQEELCITKEELFCKNNLLKGLTEKLYKEQQQLNTQKSKSLNIEKEYLNNNKKESELFSNQQMSILHHNSADSINSLLEKLKRGLFIKAKKDEKKERVFSPIEIDFFKRHSDDSLLIEKKIDKYNQLHKNKEKIRLTIKNIFSFEILKKHYKSYEKKIDKNNTEFFVFIDEKKDKHLYYKKEEEDIFYLKAPIGMMEFPFFTYNGNYYDINYNLLGYYYKEDFFFYEYKDENNIIQYSDINFLPIYIISIMSSDYDELIIEKGNEIVNEAKSLHNEKCKILYGFEDDVFTLKKLVFYLDGKENIFYNTSFKKFHLIGNIDEDYRKKQVRLENMESSDFKEMEKKTIKNNRRKIETETETKREHSPEERDFLERLKTGSLSRKKEVERYFSTNKKTKETEIEIKNFFSLKNLKKYCSSFKESKDKYNNKCYLFIDSNNISTTFYKKDNNDFYHLECDIGDNIFEYFSYNNKCYDMGYNKVNYNFKNKFFYYKIKDKNKKKKYYDLNYNQVYIIDLMSPEYDKLMLMQYKNIKKDNDYSKPLYDYEEKKYRLKRLIFYCDIQNNKLYDLTMRKFDKITNVYKNYNEENDIKIKQQTYTHQEKNISGNTCNNRYNSILKDSKSSDEVFQSSEEGFKSSEEGGQSSGEEVVIK